MKLKKLELTGFKSFMNPTSIHFNEGITAIVGPNGCGKSNVVDASRWAMGEQSAKHLRGKSMEDVIFNGSQELAPLGMAEVSLTFDNTNGNAPPEYADFSEIEVTRRLYRSGESEYLINRTPCRLKDITELFLGTGVGKQAYSIVEQGQIEQIISSKPEDRRALIEEAAGISKYRSRKQEAERKMDSTRQNLLRVRDIIAEINRQMNSLNRQAKKAERYKAYREELKQIELELFALQSIEMLTRIESQGRIQNEKRDKSEEIKARIEFAEAQLEAQRADKMELEDSLRRAQERMFEIQSNIQARENKLAYHEQEIESEKRLSERLKTEIQDLKARLAEAEAETIKLDNEKTRLQKALEVAMDAASNAETSRLELSEARRLAEEKIDALLKRSYELKQELAGLESELEHERKHAEELKESMALNGSRLKELEDGRERFRRSSLDFNQKLYDLRKVYAALTEEHRAASEDAEGMRGRLAGLKARAEEMRANYNRSVSRLESLMEMQARYEGYQRGVKSIMEKKQRDEQAGKNGIYGLVAEVVETLPEYETAVEAALGERLQSVIVKSQAQGIEAINYLRQEAAGRGTFIPLNPRGAEAAPMPAALETAGARPLLDLVEIKPDYAQVADYLLHDVILVPSLDKALELWESNGFHQTMVTPDGAVLDEHGVLAGGSGDSYGILEKKRETRELSEEVRELKARLDSIEAEINSLDEKLRERERDLEALKERGHRHEIEILNQEKELKASTQQSNQLDEKYEEIKALVEEAASQLEKVEARTREIEELIKTTAEKEQNIYKDIGGCNAALEGIKTGLADADKCCTERKVEAAACREKLHALTDRAERTARSIEELKQGIVNRNREIEAGENGLHELRALVEQTRAELNSETRNKEEFESVLSSERERFEKAQLALKQGEVSVRELREEDDALRKELADLQLEMSELRLQYEHMAENLRDKYYIDPEQAVPQYRDKVTSQDYAASERKTERDELRSRLERMGDVNLTAIDEYHELETRYEFLTTQEADLVKALDSLQKTIEKINRTYRKEFRQTFEAVNEQFQKVFPRIFRGGKAMLMLTNEHDLLETGVEIIAQPPGKKLQSITLLSGGEKSLAAVSLIIALFLHRPTPFCLLDEVDAALDDVNIDRFNDVINELSAHSQFIIITHNKRTMQMANTLYGVTMEQPGVSKIISVKLN